MTEAVHSLALECSWKLRTLFRMKRFYTGQQMVLHYKAKLLSYIEYRTPAIYHACDTALGPLDRVQDRFLREACISDINALFVFNLAPLCVRRDIAMLGVIHRTALGKGPAHFAQFFTLDGFDGRRSRTRNDDRRHGHHMVEYREGLFLNIYNQLQDRIAMLPSVKCFQGALQEIVKARAANGCEDWKAAFSPRRSLTGHPVHTLA